MTGLTYSTSGLTAYYTFTGAATTSTSVTLATLSAVTSAWSSGGFKEIDSTNMPGWYRFDVPNAAVGSGNGPEVNFHFQGASSMAPCPFKILIGTAALTAAQIATAIWQDTTSGDFTIASSIGKSLYTSGVAPGASGGLFLAGSNAATTVNITGNLSGSVGSVTGLTTATIATAVWEDTTAGGDFGTSGSIGKLIVTTGLTVSSVTGAVGSVTAITTANVTEWGGTAVAGSIPPDTVFARSNTAAAGSSTTITLDSGASSTNGYYAGQIIFIRSGTGAGQSALITSYNGGASRVATIAGTWGTTPDNTSVFTIQAFGSLTTAGIATGVWTDTTSGDFTTTSSPGKILVTQLGGAWTTTSSSVFSTAALANAPSGTGASAATIATAVWQDLLSSSDFSTASSVGALVKANTVASVTGAVGSISGVTFPANFSSFEIDASGRVDLGKILGTASAGAAGYVGHDWSAVHAPTSTVALTNTTISTGQAVASVSGAVGSVTGSVGGSVTGSVGSISGVTFPTHFSALAIDVSGDVTFNNTSLSGSVGSVTGAVGSVTGAVGSVTGNVGGNVAGNVVGSTGSVAGAVASVTAPVSITLTQQLSAARALDSIADTSLTLNDALHCAVAGAAGKQSVVGTAYTIETPSTGTVLRTFTLDSGSAPTERS